MPEIAFEEGEQQGDEDLDGAVEADEAAGVGDTDMDDPEVKMLAVVTKVRAEIAKEVQKLSASITSQIKQAQDVIEAAKDRAVESTHKDALPVLKKRLSVLLMTVAINCNFSARQGPLYYDEGTERFRIFRPIRNHNSLSFMWPDGKRSFDLIFGEVACRRRERNSLLQLG